MNSDLPPCSPKGGLILSIIEYSSICHSISHPLGRAERKEPARWAGLAKEPACREGLEAARGPPIHETDTRFLIQ